MSCRYPSAVSHRINQLKPSWESSVCPRSPKWSFTHEGKRVFWALKSLDTLNQETSIIKNQELSGTLTVCIPLSSIAQCWLVPALGILPRRYPSISSSLLTGNDNVNLQRAGISTAIYFLTMSRRRSSRTILMDEAILPVCSPDYAHRFALQDNLNNRQHCILTRQTGVE